jgi:hypothetical protein
MFPSKRLGLGIVGLLTALVAWPALFSTLAPYDDEGYCMMTLRTFAQGDRLYGATHTQYGPAYYFITSPIHEWLHWPLTQTGVRIKTLLAWCMAAVLVYLFVTRSQKEPSHLAAIGIAMVAILHLDKLSLEPGHPQEMVLLGSLLSMFLIPTRSQTGNSISNTGWFTVGLVAAVIGFTKLNCGMVLAVALIVSAIIGSPCSRRLRLGVACLAAFPAILIACMARSDLGTVLWALWTALCAGTAAIRMEKNSNFSDAQSTDPGDKPRQVCWYNSHSTCRAVVRGGLLASIAFVSLSLSSGTTPNELWFGLIGQHVDFGSDFFKPIPWNVSCMLGVLSVVALFWSKSTGYFQSRSMVIVGGLVILLMAWTALEPLQHGLKPRGVGAFMAWFLPGWLGLVYRSQSNERFAVLLGILSPLIAFPVSGTQVEIGTIPGLVIFGLAVSRLIRRARIRDATSMRKQKLDTQLGYRFLGAVIFLFVAAAFSHWYRYASSVPLGLPGSEGMRLSKSMVEEQRAIVAAVKASQSETLVFEGHNNNRFYFWTGTKPATAANPTFWPRMLNESERLSLQETLARPGRYCVIRVPEYERFYDVRTKEIQEQLRTGWERTSTIGEWDVGVIDSREASELDRSR